MKARWVILALLVVGCTDDGDEASGGNPFTPFFEVPEPPITGVDCAPLTIDFQAPAATCRFDIPDGTPGELPAGDYTMTAYLADCGSPYTTDVRGAMRVQHLPSGDILIKERRPDSIPGYPDRYVSFVYAIDPAGVRKDTTCDPFLQVPGFEHIDTTATTVTIRFDAQTTLVYTRQ